MTEMAKIRKDVYFEDFTPDLMLEASKLYLTGALALQSQA